MANLSKISAGASEVEVEDFYQPGQRRVIKLKPTETPQRTAQNLYRKAKNQQRETRERFHWPLPPLMMPSAQEMSPLLFCW